MAEWARGLGIDLDPQARELARWPRVIMGFVSKGIESADQLLREGDRDPGPRGQKMREHGLAIIDYFHSPCADVSSRGGRLQPVDGQA